MCRSRPAVLAAIAISVMSSAPAALRAQFPAEVRAGARVRVWVPEPYRQEDGPSRPASAIERAVGGAIGGAISFAAMNDPRRTGGPHYHTDWRAAGVGAAWGAGLGALVGFIFPHEQWRGVRLRR